MASSEKITGDDNGGDASIPFFYDSDTAGQKVPRSVFIDLEPTVIDQVRTGTYRQLFHPDYFISGKEDAANIFSRGHYTVGKEIIEITLDRIRKLAESCENLQGFLFFNSVSCGTGSGFFSLLLERMNVEYKNKSIFTFILYPSPGASNSVVETYNSAFTTFYLFEVSDVNIILNNDALYNINSSLNSFHQPSNMMVMCDPRQGQYLACCMMYRGDIVPSEVICSIREIKSKQTINFVDWCPMGFKVGINYKSPTVVPGGDLVKVTRSCSMISNSTAIKSLFSSVGHKFDLLLQKRAFQHWYFSEGSEDLEFGQARRNLEDLENDYEAIDKGAKFSQN